MNNYIKRCGYNLGKLKPYIYLIERNKSNISIDISNLSFNIIDSVKRLNVEEIEFSHNQSNYNKFQFSTNLSVILNESSNNIELVNEIKNNNYIVIIEDYQNIKYLLNIDFNYKITYEQIFAEDSNHIQIDFSILSNYPLFESNKRISYTNINNIENYSIGGIRKLKLINKDKVTISKNGELSYDQKDLFDIAFYGCNSNIEYNGYYYKENITFQIDWDNAFAYSLIEHPNNQYIAIIESNNRLYYIIGKNGLQAKYDANIGDDLNVINISLESYSNWDIINSSMPYITSYRNYGKLCDGYNLYEYDSLQYTEDGIKWNSVYPLQLVKGNLVATNSIHCINGEYIDNDNYSIEVIMKGNGNSISTLYNNDSQHSISYVTIDGIRYDGNEVTFGDNEEHTIRYYGMENLNGALFSTTTNIEKITINNIDKIDYLGFANMTSLKEIDIPITSNVVIEPLALYGSQTLEHLNLEGVTYLIPSIEGNGYDINGQQFSNAINLQDVIIGNGITYIPYRCFYNCPKLNNVIFGSNIYEIGENAFEGCSSLNEMIFKCDNPPIVGTDAFIGLPTDGTIYVNVVTKEWVEWVNTYLNGWNIVGEVEEPSITLIHQAPNSEFAFGFIINTSFTSLPNYEVGMSNSPINYSYIKIDGKIATLEGMGMYYFGDTNEHVVEFYGVDEISDYAFHQCYSIKKVEFSSKIKEIGFGAFYDCTSLNEIKFNDIRKINSFGFYGCNSLQNLIFEKNIEYIGENAFARNGLHFEHDKLENIVIPKGANCVIDKYSFKCCANLVEANLEGVTRINNYSFDDCNLLTSVVFGDKLEYIGWNVFETSRMRTLTFNSPTPPTVEYFWFQYPPTDGTVYVPSEYYGSTWGTWVNTYLKGWTLRALE